MRCRRPVVHQHRDDLGVPLPHRPVQRRVPVVLAHRSNVRLAPDEDFAHVKVPRGRGEVERRVAIVRLGVDFCPRVEEVLDDVHVLLVFYGGMQRRHPNVVTRAQAFVRRLPRAVVERVCDLRRQGWCERGWEGWKVRRRYGCNQGTWEEASWPLFSGDCNKRDGPCIESCRDHSKGHAVRTCTATKKAVGPEGGRRRREHAPHDTSDTRKRWWWS